VNNASRRRSSGNGSVTPRRAEEILDAAVTLFRAKGYQNTTLEQIGAAVGISGPAIYNHYENKQAILIAAVEGVAERVRANTDATRDGTPAALLRELVSDYVDTVITHRDAISVYLNEQNALPIRVRRRSEGIARAHLDVWASALREARQGLSELEAQTLVWGVFFLVNSLAYHESELSTARTKGVLTTAAFAALELPDGRPPRSGRQRTNSGGRST
jgi:AcrR family transcriptional regulator